MKKRGSSLCWEKCCFSRCVCKIITANSWVKTQTSFMSGCAVSKSMVDLGYNADSWIQKTHWNANWPIAQGYRRILSHVAKDAIPSIKKHIPWILYVFQERSEPIAEPSRIDVKIGLPFADRMKTNQKRHGLVRVSFGIDWAYSLGKTMLQMEIDKYAN